MSARTCRLPSSVRDAIARRGEEDYPEETCGFIFGPPESLLVVPMENIQNRLHAEDPVRYDRDARTAYYFDPTAMQRVLAEQEAAGRELWAIYHSHPDEDSYFSETDSAAASPLGGPTYPGVFYLVLSVRERKTVDLKAFDWFEGSGAYVEAPVEVATG